MAGEYFIHGRALIIRVNRAGLRGASGRYIPRASIGNREAELAHKALAERVQQLSVENIAQNSSRPQTGRLKRVTGDARNISFTPQGWGVGRPRFLNKSEALYWRTIDEGSKATFSRGGFAGSLIYPYVPEGVRFNQAGEKAWYSGVTPDGRRAAGTPGAAYGTGKVRAMSHAAGALLAAKYPRYQPIVVKNEIRAQRYYERAFADMSPEIRAARAERVILDRAWKRLGV